MKMHTLIFKNIYVVKHVRTAASEFWRIVIFKSETSIVTRNSSVVYHGRHPEKVMQSKLYSQDR